jgi:hypothetical protein
MPRNKASARRRATDRRTSATMANSTAVSGLLGRQLASISDTLVRASRRRDAEVQRRAASRSSAAPAVQAPVAPSPTKPSLTSNTEDSAPSNSVVFPGHQKNFTTQKFGRFDRDQPQADRIMGWIRSIPATVYGHTNVFIDDTTPRPSLRSGYESNGDDDSDVKKMRAHFAAGPPTDAHEIDPKHKLAQLDRTNFAVGAGESLDPKKLLAELAHLDSPHAAQTEYSNNDVASMLADLNQILFPTLSPSSWRVPVFRGRRYRDGLSISSAQASTVIKHDGPRTILWGK